MKRLMITLSLALPFSVQADTSVALEFCKPIHGLAETIMERRQEGVSMVKMLEIANPSDGGSIKELSISLVEEAYSSPRYHTPENQQRAVQDFGNEKFKMCMDFMKEIEK